MANLFQTISSGDGELKRLYRGPMIELLNDSVPIYRAAQKVKDGVSGSATYVPLRVRRNQGIGATTDGGNLPSIGRSTTIQANIGHRYLYLRFGITAGMIKAAQNDAGSFVREYAYSLKSGFQDFKSDLNRQLGWDGTCSLALTSTASVASSSVVVKGRETDDAALRFLDVGMIVDIYNSTGATLKAGGVTINSISAGTAISTTATLQLDTAVTSAVGDIWVRQGSISNEIQGILTALDGGTTTIYGVDRSAYLSYQGNVVSNSSAALSIDAMQNPFNEGLRRGSVGHYNAVFTDFTSLRMYQKLLVPDKRYQGMEGDATFGKKGQFYMDFNGIPVVPDKDCSRRMLFLPAEVLKLFQLCEMEQAEESGAPFIPQSDTDSFEVRIRNFCNLFNEQPAACGVLTTYISP
jgi:hypothetical protein